MKIKSMSSSSFKKEKHGWNKQNYFEGNVFIFIFYPEQFFVTKIFSFILFQQC